MCVSFSYHAALVEYQYLVQYHTVDWRSQLEEPKKLATFSTLPTKKWSRGDISVF
jgi:hypothetical protein